MDKKKYLALFKNLGVDDPDFNDLAKATRFKSRFRSLMAFDFLFTLLVSCSQHCVSYNTMARNLYSLGGQAVSKQALQKAMTSKRFLLFIKMIFKTILAESVKKNGCSFMAACLI